MRHRWIPLVNNGKTEYNSQNSEKVPVFPVIIKKGELK